MHAELASRPGACRALPRLPWSLPARPAGRSAQGRCGAMCSGLTVASSALGLRLRLPDPGPAGRALPRCSARTPGWRRSTGRPAQIQTVAGYTVWKSFMFLIIVGAVWGLLTGTRLLRGEEDAGRWELLLAGQTTRRRAAGQALAGLGAGLAALWALTAVITVVVGQLPRVGIAAGPMLFFAVALVAPAAMFLAAGALASQLAATRRQAAAYAGAALGVCYALRMVADSGTGLELAAAGRPRSAGSKSSSRSPPPARWRCCRSPGSSSPSVASACTLRGRVISAPAPSPTATGRGRGPGCWRGRPGWRCAWCARPCWPGRQRSPSGRCCWVPSPSRAGAS